MDVGKSSKFLSLLHNNTEGHDKIWGIVQGNQCGVLTFWGKRGAKLSFQLVEDIAKARRQADSKVRKGYKASKEDVLPEDFDMQLMFAVLKKV